MVMPIKDKKLDGAAGAGAVGGLRPTAVPAPAAAAPELSDRPRRRTFTVQEKLRVLAETDGAALTFGGRYRSRLFICASADAVRHLHEPARRAASIGWTC